MAEPNQAADADTWADKIEDALNRGERHSLSLAEEAVRTCPGDYTLLCLAATAALIEERPDRAQLYLKRLRKRYEPGPTYPLLLALALDQQKRRSAALELLKQNNLTSYVNAMRVFPGGVSLSRWLSERVNAITGVEARAKAKPKSNVARPNTAKPTATKPTRGMQPVPAKVGTPMAAPMAVPTVAAAPALRRIESNIPIQVDFANLSEIAPGNGTPPDALTWYRLRDRFTHLSLLSGFDELLCLPYLQHVETYWYQVETARKVLKQFHGRVLLADEVGLGKTVEAGMVLKEYLLRGMADRLLVLVPPSLVGQWREELETKFGIEVATTHDPMLREDPERFWAQPRLVASIAAARRRENAALLGTIRHDIVVVDEAHHLKDRASQSYKLIDSLPKRFLLLLSATPVQNSLIELYNLLTLLQPGIFKTQKEFRAAYMTPGKPRMPVNQERLRDLMRRVMIRNTRAVVALRLPRRHATTHRVEGGPAERSCYEDLNRLVRATAASAATRNRLVLRHLLSAAGSSPAAATAAVNRYAERHPAGDAAAWADLAKRYAAIASGGKEAALIDLLKQNPQEKKLVFVHHRDTLASLATLLREQRIDFALFEGGLSGPDKDAAITAFRDRVPVLLSTESGGEGRNIQFCNTLINFDIPWNPMVIEQRIGRVDRIGQQREVFIFNLVTRGTLEDQVLRILDEKINMFELVVGEVSAILGEIDEEQDFSELIMSAWLETTEASRAQALDELGRRLSEARSGYDSTKQFDDELFGENFETA
jgi:SNF2 family DNA or RNA helicase